MARTPQQSSTAKRSFANWSDAQRYAGQLRDQGDISPAEFDAIKQQSLSNGPLPVPAALASARKRGGKVKRVTRTKELGTIGGGSVRQRLDRPGRKSAGMAQHRPKRADGGNVEPPPGADRSNYQEPSADYIAEGAKKHAADILGVPGDTERLITKVVDSVANKLGYDPQLSKNYVYPGTESIQRQWGVRKRGGTVK